MAEGDTAATQDAGAAAPVDSATEPASSSSGVAQGATADEVAQVVSDALAADHDEVVTLTSAEEVLRHVPQDAPAFVGGYLTPVLWGIAAGFVAYLIGYIWDAFMRLLGLASRK